MKLGHVIFNVVGLFIAGMLLLSALSAYFVVLPGAPIEKRGFWHLLIVLEAISIVLIAGGGIANFANGRLTGWPTGTMIFAYSISVWLLPFGIWGIVILLAEHKRRQRETSQPPRSADPN
ncbi:hypothetical protein GC207_13505 [bacterium]|nr:hypothetical protein [bacterium]